MFQSVNSPGHGGMVEAELVAAAVTVPPRTIARK
jgi:hypothetical protein